MIKETVDNYLTVIYNMFSSGDAREESYYTILESFILKIRDILKRPGLRVTIMPKKTEAIVNGKNLGISTKHSMGLCKFWSIVKLPRSWTANKYFRAVLFRLDNSFTVQ